MLKNVTLKVEKFFREQDIVYTQLPVYPSGQIAQWLVMGPDQIF